MASVMTIIPLWLKVHILIILLLLFLKEPTFENQKISLLWRITWDWQMTVFVQTDGCCSSSHLCCCFSYFYESKCLHLCVSQKMERYSEWTVWFFSHMSNLTCFCHPHLSWWPIFLKFRERWDPGEENILVSSVLSINKAWRLYDLSQRISHEFIGLGLSTWSPPGN